MNIKSTLFTLLLATTLGAGVKAQHTHAEWAKHIVGNETTTFNKIIKNDAAMIAAGFWFLGAEFNGITLPNHLGSNALIVKMDFDGNVQWHSTMTGDGYDTFFDIVQDSENNIIVAGWSSSNASIEINGVTVYEPDMEWTSRGVVAKFSGNDGSLLWFKVINPNEEYRELTVTKVAVDEDDNIYISGYSNSGFEIEEVQFPYTQQGWGSLTYLAKLNPNGSIVWGNQFHFVPEGDAGWSMPRAIKVVNDTLVFAFQYSKPVHVGADVLPYEGEGFYDWIGLVKMSVEDATVSKTFAYGSTLDQNIADVETDRDGNILIAGFFTSESNFSIDGVSPVSYGVEDGYVAKLNSEFELIWLRSMGSEFSSRCFNISISNDNRIFIGGGFDSYTPLYFEGHKLINAESPTNSLAMFQVVMDGNGDFEKAFALHGQDINSIVEYKDAILLDNDRVIAVGSSVDTVQFIENTQFYSDHWAGFLLKWNLSRKFYKIFFEVTDETGNSLEEAVVTLDGMPNPYNKHSFYQINQGLYNYEVSVEGYITVTGETEVTDENVTIPVTLLSTNTLVESPHLVSVKIFPNPASDEITIQSAVEMVQCQIFDATGKRVFFHNDVSNSLNVNAESFPNGFYVILVNTTAGTTARKIQITR